MKNYRPDPKNPPRLTAEEQRRLAAAPIDYSDIPELNEEFFTHATRPAMTPNRETVEAMKAAERGEVTNVGHPRNLLKSLNTAMTDTGGDEIDWSDWSRTLTTDKLPPRPLLRGEQWLTALLLQMVVEHCATGDPDYLDSHYIFANAEAMSDLHEGGEIEIVEEQGDRMRAKLTATGRALLERLDAEKLVIDWDGIDWSQCPEVERVPGRCSGMWVVKGTRITVQGILDNATDCTPEEIGTEIFRGVTVEQVRRILAYAGVEP